MDVSSQLVANKDDLAELMKSMSSFEERLKKATTASPPPQTDLAALIKDFAEFKSSVWKVLSKLSAQTELLSLGLDRHETFMRRKVLLIHGLPESKEEKVNQTVLDLLSSQMKLPDITLGDIQSCHRLGAASKKRRPVVVRFRELEVRRLVWDSKTSLKGSGVTIAEFLTKARRDVFMAGRRHFGMRNCWTSDGRIVVALPDKTRRKVETTTELQSLCSAFPPIKETTSSGRGGNGLPAASAAPATGAGIKSATAGSSAKPTHAAVVRRLRNKQ